MDQQARQKTVQALRAAAHALEATAKVRADLTTQQGAALALTEMNQLNKAVRALQQAIKMTAQSPRFAPKVDDAIEGVERALANITFSMQGFS